jgi:hypothetical protein
MQKTELLQLTSDAALRIDDDCRGELIVSDLQFARLLIGRLNKLCADEGVLTLLEQLIEHRVPVIDAVAEHPTIQCSPTDEGGYACGLLGVLNGIAGIRPDHWGYVAGVFNDKTGALERFEVLEDETVRKFRNGDEE